MSPILMVTIIGLCTYLINNYIKNRRFWKLLDDFYGYKPLPLIGNAHQFGTTMEEVLEKGLELCKKAQYTTTKTRIGYTVFVLVSEPQNIEAILTNNREITKMNEYSYLKDWLGDGLLLSTGAKWKQRRKIITPSFHFGILEQFVKVFSDSSNIMVELLDKECNNDFNVHPCVNAFALDIVCETALGVCMNLQRERNSEYVKAVESLCRLMQERVISPFKSVDFLYKFTSDYAEYNRLIKVLHNVTDNVIRKRREILKEQIEAVRNGLAAESNDEFLGKNKKIAFLDMLLLNKLPDGSFLSDEDIREEVDTFTFAGHDTTTASITFTLYCLANNPDVQQKALEEILSILGDDPNIEITYQQLQQMKYLEMVIKESMRLYPPIPIYGRNLENDFELPGPVPLHHLHHSSHVTGIAIIVRYTRAIYQSLLQK